METQLVKAGPKDIVRDGAFDLTPHSLSEAMQLAEMMAKSELVPQNFRNKPADVLIAVQFGAELGLLPLQALSSIAVINGRATIWGDGLLGLVLNSGMMENYKEMTCEEIEAAGKAVFWCKRKGNPEPIQREFSIEDAKKAHLWNNPAKKPIWTDYPFRMLQMRARSWALRDGFADVLKGLQCREEVEDYEITEAPPALAMPRRLSARQQIAEPDPTDVPPKQEQRDAYIPPEQEELPEATPPTDAVISDPQRKRLFAISKKAGYTDDQMKQLLNACGYQHSADVLKKHYQAICESIEGTPIDQLPATIDYLGKWCKEN
jgi:hypothetical protein